MSERERERKKKIVMRKGKEFAFTLSPEEND